MTNNTDTKTTARPRIGTLTPGQRVELQFGKTPQIETVKFLRHETGEETGGQRAIFEDVDHNGKTFEWQAYRYNNRWSFGTGAQPLRLVRVVPVEQEEPEERFWFLSMSEDEYVGVNGDDTTPFADLYQVNDETTGGTIAYVGSEETARMIVNALRAANA